MFFAQQQGQYSVCLLLADQNGGEDGVPYKPASARGATPAQALHRTEDTLPGPLYYGDVYKRQATSVWDIMRSLARPGDGVSLAVTQGCLLYTS